MKKIFAVFALFIALIFVVSCGGSEDSGLTVGGRMMDYDGIYVRCVR